MTVRDLYVSGCCFGTNTIISIDIHNNDSSTWKNIYIGKWDNMPPNIRDLEVEWFDIFHDNSLMISVERGRVKRI